MKEKESFIDEYILNHTNRISPSDLDRTIQYKSTNGGVKSIDLRQMAWHMVEDELQHTDELNALLWQMDIDPPITDWIEWREEICISRNE